MTLNPDFTALERAILDAICDGELENSVGLKRLLDTAQLVERDNTGHGFYTNLSVSRELPAVSVASPIHGPIAHMIDMGPGMLMGFLLWFAEGYPNCLEGYQFVDELGNEVDLHERDLATLKFSRLDWELGNPRH